MRSNLIIAAQCAVLLILPHSAIEARFSLNQDTPTGNYSWWRGEDLRASGTLSATVTVNQLRGDEKWAPWVGFQLKSSATPADSMDLKFIFSMKTQAGTAEITVTEKGKTTQTIKVPGTFPIKKSFDIAIRWSTGAVKINVSGIPERDLPLPFVPAQMHIWSGTADVTIQNVEVQ